MIIGLAVFLAVLVCLAQVAAYHLAKRGSGTADVASVFLTTVADILAHAALIAFVGGTIIAALF